MINFFILLIHLAWATGSNVTLEPVYDELEGPALVQQLIRDQKWDLAESQLKDLSIDSQTFLFKVQILNSTGREHEAALLLQNPKYQTDEILFERARSFSLMKNAKKCSEEKFRQTAVLEFKKIQLLFDCHMKAERPALAYSLLVPRVDLDSRNLLLQFLLDRKIIGEAVALIEEQIQKKVSPDLLLSWIEKLPSFEKTRLLEVLKASGPTHEAVLLAWADHQYQTGNRVNALSGFQTLSQLNPEWNFIAGELHRTQGLFEQAQWYAWQVPKKEESLKLKMSTAIDRQRYLELLGLQGPVERNESIVSEQNFIYALIYANVSAQIPQRGQILLRHLRDPELIKKSQILLKQTQLN